MVTHDTKDWKNLGDKKGNFTDAHAHNSQSKRENLEGDLQDDQVQKTPCVKNKKPKHSHFSYAMQARATNSRKSSF